MLVAHYFCSTSSASSTSTPALVTYTVQQTFRTMTRVLMCFVAVGLVKISRNQLRAARRWDPWTIVPAAAISVTYSLLWAVAGTAVEGGPLAR